MEVLRELIGIGESTIDRTGMMQGFQIYVCIVKKTCGEGFMQKIVYRFVSKFYHPSPCWLPISWSTRVSLPWPLPSLCALSIPHALSPPSGRREGEGRRSIKVRKSTSGSMVKFTYKPVYYLLHKTLSACFLDNVKIHLESLHHSRPIYGTLPDPY